MSDGAAQGASALSAAGDTAASSQSEPENKPVKIPDFVDKVRGGIKDLPIYPRSRRQTVQIGPRNGLDMMTVFVTSRDSVETIAAFYDKAVKINGWKIVDSMREPDVFQFVLAKGSTSEAVVKAQRDPSSNRTQILVSRGEKDLTQK